MHLKQRQTAILLKKIEIEVRRQKFLKLIDECASINKDLCFSKCMMTFLNTHREVKELNLVGVNKNCCTF